MRIGQRVRVKPENRIAEIYKWEELAGNYRVGLIFEDNSEAKVFVLKQDEIEQRLEPLHTPVELFRQKEGILPSEHSLAFAEALRMRLAYTFDPHYAISVTQVDLLPHQVDAIYRHILPQPQVRYLLADDPGLGKTIMAGLLIEELKAREMVHSILIVVPAHLIDQWQREMGEWFREQFFILNRASLNNLHLANFFKNNPQLLVSLDFARQDRVREILRDHRWDLVIVDEAHKLSATRYGRKIGKTKRYQLGELLAERCNHMLLLTATPHRGDDEAYFLLLNLLYPRLFANSEQLRQTARAQALPFVLRRSKEQVTDLQGNKLFKERKVISLDITLTEYEKALYEAVTDYVRRWYATVSQNRDQRSRNVALALTVLQRRLSSSLSAVRKSLERRRNKLETLLRTWQNYLNEEEWLDDDAFEDLSEQSASEWEQLQEKLDTLTAAQSPAELQEEIDTLYRLIRMAEQAEKAGEEAKVQQLRRVIEERLRHHPDEKLIIFTEFKDTLDALRDKIESWGFPTASIHGGMDLKTRIEQERYFRDHVQVLIGTDAAGEGLNLQFARLMINFDLPWNPNRLEQRMGRIHRYGQTRDCYVYNMLYSETCEGRVLQCLMQKLERMRLRLGDSIYDVIGELMASVPLEKLIMEAIQKQDTTDVEHVIEQDIEVHLQEYQRALQENALAGHHIDLSAVQLEGHDSRQKRLVPWDVERFTKWMMPLIGGHIEADAKGKGVFRLTLPTPFLKQHQLDKTFARGVRIAFERKIARQHGAEFFAPGHPALEALINHCIERPRPVLGLFAHPDGKEGVLWLFRTAVQDGKGGIALERLLALFYSLEDQQWRKVDPRMLWDLADWADEAPVPETLLAALEEHQEEARQQAIQYLQPLYEEAAQRRERETRIKREWLEKSYDHLLQESDAKLLDYMKRAEAGEDMSLVIRNEEEHYKSLKREWEERLKALELEQSLTPLEPQLEAIFLIGNPTTQPTTPTHHPPDPNARRRIEAIGMEVAMQHERAEGRQPTDVSKEYLGYDIVSEGNGERRYIEVKAFATSGQLIMTPNERQMCQRLGDEYWLYVVENAATNPTLRCIRNPAQYPAEAITGVVGFVLHDWKEDA
jgi:superfamily II DNA or RNA helicase